MFTGLIQSLGTVARVAPGPVTDVFIDSPLSDFAVGESIACDGVCLTVIDWRGGTFHVQAAPETLRRTTLGDWRAGTRVNLERALRMGDRLGGHWVQGHVDGVATVTRAQADGGSWAMGFSLAPALAPFFVEKGSVCLDGVSLTLTQVGQGDFSVMLIPETRAKTSLGQKGPGARVNVEVDIVGKYVARMMGPRGGLTREQLEAAGFGA